MSYKNNRKGFGKDIWGELVDAAKDVARLTDQQIQDGIKNRKSLTEIIRAAGSSVQMVEARTRTIVTDKLAQAVNDGSLTRNQADTILENLDTVIDRLINHKGHHQGSKADAVIATVTATATATVPAAQ